MPPSRAGAVVAVPSGVRGASAGWCAGWVARRSCRQHRGYGRERRGAMHHARRHARHAPASSARHNSPAASAPDAPSGQPGARPTHAAATPSNTHSPATPPSTSPPGHDRFAASRTRPRHAPHTTTPQPHSRTKHAASSRACDQHRSHTPAAWTAPYALCTTMDDTQRTRRPVCQPNAPIRVTRRHTSTPNTKRHPHTPPTGTSHPRATTSRSQTHPIRPPARG